MLVSGPRATTERGAVTADVAKMSTKDHHRDRPEHRLALDNDVLFSSYHASYLAENMLMCPRHPRASPRTAASRDNDSTDSNSVATSSGGAVLHRRRPGAAPGPRLIAAVGLSATVLACECRSIEPAVLLANMSISHKLEFIDLIQSKPKVPGSPCASRNTLELSTHRRSKQH